MNEEEEEEEEKQTKARRRQGTDACGEEWRRGEKRDEKKSDKLRVRERQCGNKRT